MDNEIKNKINEIGKNIIETSDNLNGNHKRTIRELEREKKNIDELVENLREDKKYKGRVKRLRLMFGIIFGLFLLSAFVFASINYRVGGDNKLVVGENKTIVIGDLEVVGTIELEHIKIKSIDENDWECNETTAGEIVHLLNNESLGTHVACRQKKGGLSYEAKVLY